MKLNLTLIPIFVALALPVAAAEAKLRIGDPAPPLKAAQWFKGTPIASFNSNEVYVVEFWATWCVPCRKSIPHLTELAKQYAGKAHIAGFSIWETEKTDQAKRLAGVAKFVTKLGDEMDYNVAADDNDGFMAANWMEAAGENGIPTAFVIGRDGRIAWIGNPAAGLDAALADVVAGTLDKQAVQVEADARQKQRDIQAQQREWLKGVTELENAKKYAEAVTELDQVERDHSELAGKVGYFRYKLLLGYDEPAAYQQARQLLAGELKNNSSSLYAISRDLTDPGSRKVPDWDLALAVAGRACELSRNKNPSHLSCLAEAYFGKGDAAKAVEIQSRAIELATADKTYPASSLAYLQRRLERFKSAQPGATKHAKL